MSYFLTLPKELRILLDHYVNYQHWNCLFDILSQYKLISTYMDDTSKNLFVLSTSKLLESLPIRFDSEIKYEPKCTVCLIKLSINRLITKDSLFKTLCILFDHYSRCEIHNHAIINDCLRKHGYNERIAYIFHSENSLTTVVKI